MSLEKRIDEALGGKTLSEASAHTNEFRGNVKVSIHSDADNFYIVDHEEEVKIPYFINVEYRSWGIKSFDVSVPGAVKLWVRIEDPSGNEKEGNVVVDLSELPREVESGDSIQLKELEIWLDKAGQVNYELSQIAIIKPSVGD